MPPITKEIVDSYGALIWIRDGEWIGAAGAIALTLGFERGVVLVTADADDDTIRLTVGDPATGRDVSNEAPWRDAIGRELLWLWMLTNQQGYEDGCQFEFGRVVRNDQPERLCIQLMVAGATLHVSAFVAEV